jgi:hypothetical protein
LTRSFIIALISREYIVDPDAEFPYDPFPAGLIGGEHLRESHLPFFVILSSFFSSDDPHEIAVPSHHQVWNSMSRFTPT